MSISLTDAASRERDVAADDCSDVVDALALVTALAMDPHASVVLQEPKPSAEPVISPVLASNTSPIASPASHSLETPPDRGTLPRSVPGRWRYDLDLGAVMWWGPAPDALAGGALFAEVEPTRSQSWAPSVRLGATLVSNGAFETPAAQIWLAVARIDACPLRSGSHALTLESCVGVDVGWVHGKGIDVAEPAAANRPWLDIPVSLVARWVPGTSRFFLAVEPNLIVPVTRPEFVFRTPVIVVHTVPSAGLVAMASAGWRLW
jgi:hypothetical protein